jgi:hypothetical protein
MLSAYRKSPAKLMASGQSAGLAKTATCFHLHYAKSAEVIGCEGSSPSIHPSLLGYHDMAMSKCTTEDQIECLNLFPNLSIHLTVKMSLFVFSSWSAVFIGAEVAALIEWPLWHCCCIVLLIKRYHSCRKPGMLGFSSAQGCRTSVVVCRASDQHSNVDTKIRRAEH